MQHSIGIFIVVFTAVPFAVLAHGNAEGIMSSGTMGEMMTLMHGQMEKSASVGNCGSLNEEAMMEYGEGMMEEMMGSEDHERVEEAMEQDMHDHDAMHLMMGMAATGCFGEEVAASVARQYGIAAEEGDDGDGTESRLDDSGTFAIGIIGGLILGFLGSGFFKKKPAAVPPAAPSA